MLKSQPMTCKAIDCSCFVLDPLEPQLFIGWSDLKLKKGCLQYVKGPGHTQSGLDPGTCVESEVAVLHDRRYSALLVAMIVS